MIPGKVLDITVAIDSREKTPLPFPTLFHWRRRRGHPLTIIHVTTDVHTIQAGDYYLESNGGVQAIRVAPPDEWKDIVRIERKKGVRELNGNLCGRDFSRQAKALKKFRDSCRHPIMLIEDNPVAFHMEAEREGVGFLLDFLYAETRRFNIEILWGGRHRTAATRRHLGEVILRRMLHEIFPPSVLTGKAAGGILKTKGDTTDG